MGLFSRKAKEWDTPRSDENKEKMRALFNGAVTDGDSYKIVYGFSQDARLKGVLVTRSVTTISGLIIGYRESDMSIVLLPVTKELDQCATPEFYKRSDIKKAKIAGGQYTIYHQGGMMAGYSSFSAVDENDEDYLPYLYQPEEGADFEAFWKQYSA